MTSPSSNQRSDKFASHLANHLDGYAAQTKGKTGLKRIINAAGYSKDGLVAAYQNEAAFRQVAWLNSILLIALIFLPSSFFSLIVELFNTGIEASIDHTSTEHHPLAKIGKDVGSAAQLLALTMLFLLWMMALYTTFINFY